MIHLPEAPSYMNNGLAFDDTQLKTPSLRTGLALEYLPGIDMGGDTIEDHGPRKTDATLNDTYTWSESSTGKVWYPDGVDGYADCGPVSAGIINEIDGDFTYCLWFDIFGLTIPAGMRLFGVSNSGGAPDPHCFLRVTNQSGTSSKMLFKMEDDATVEERATTSGTIDWAGNMRCVGIKYDWSAETGNIWVDGQRDAESENTQAGTIGALGSNAINIMFGAANSNGTPSNFANIGYAAVLMWVRQLDDAEMIEVQNDLYATRRRVDDHGF